MLRRLLNTLVDATRAVVLALTRPRELALENLALRQQVASLASKPHSRPNGFDRIFWAAIVSIWSSWRSALCFVRPDTVVRWHRSGFRLFWRRRSRPAVGRPAIDKEIRDLVVEMATENPIWGAPRIHGELLKLGFEVAQATVAKYMPKHPRNCSPVSPDWSTFLKLHLEGSVGIDFFDIPTATFNVLHGFLVIDHKRRELLHVGVTDHPSAEWTANQFVAALPEDSTPDRLFRDRDAIFGSTFTARVKAIGIEQHISAPRSPWQNPFAERMIGSIRRDLLDHVIVLNERHAIMLLREYQKAYYNPWRTHIGLDKDTPTGRRAQSPADGAEIVSIPILGGLHHRYERRRHAA